VWYEERNVGQAGAGWEDRQGEVPCAPVLQQEHPLQGARLGIETCLSEPTSPTGLLNRCQSPLELGTRSYRATADFFRVGRDRPLPYVLA